MFKYDTKDELKVKDEQTLLFGEKSIFIFGIENPEQISWGSANIVFDCTGAFTDKDKATAHLKIQQAWLKLNQNHFRF